MIEHRVVKVISEISSTGVSAKRLTLTSWNGNPAKMDLRVWRTEDGENRPGKGLTLNDDEARTLYEALHRYYTER